MTMINPDARVTTADLDWWLELAPQLAWTFAKTYAETAPHSYIVLGGTPSVTSTELERAAAVIRTFGQPAKYYKMTNIYLTSPDGELKWWTMDRAVAGTNLINQATTERIYGEQNAPSTHSGIWSVYDEIATNYDRLYSSADGDEKTGLLRLVSELDLPDAPTTLDVGCGTGALLDLGITTPDRYLGVDPSQAMLNELVIKYSARGLSRVIPMRIEDAVGEFGEDAFDLVCAVSGSASYVEPEALAQLARLSLSAMILMFYANGYAPAYGRATSTERFAADEFARQNGGQIARLGRFDVVLIQREGRAKA